MVARVRALLGRGALPGSSIIVLEASPQLGKQARSLARNEELAAVVRFLTREMVGYQDRWRLGADEGNARIAGALRDAIGSLQSRVHRGEGSVDSSLKGTVQELMQAQYPNPRLSGPPLLRLDPKEPGGLRFCPSGRSEDAVQSPRGWERS
jgi:hypothetical protein